MINEGICLIIESLQDRQNTALSFLLPHERGLPTRNLLLNGVVLHHHKEVMGPTVHRALAKYVAQPTEDALVLQDHQQPVRYRNIWIRRLRGYDQP